MIKKLCLGCFILFSAFNCFAEEDFDLYVGEIKILRVGDIERIAVGNSGILSTSMLNNGQLLLIGEAAGDSNVHIWFKDGSERDYSVHITAEVNKLISKKMEVEDLLSEVGGLKVRIVGDKIVLSGEIEGGYTDAIATVQGVFPEVMNLTKAGSLDLSSPDNKMVLMNIKITEFNKNYLKSIGIQWDTTVAGPAAALAFDATANSTFRASELPATSFNGLAPGIAESPLGYFGVVSEITSRINFAVNSGNALVLAEPRLAARSGGEATFLAGGEFPIETSNINGTTVEFKQFGIQLDVKPIVDINNNVRANVSTELSAIDNSVAVNGIPGLLSRKTTADVILGSGETLVMSGLLNQQASKDTSGVAFLKDIPILGELFKSKTFRDNRSELVIFVTPKVFDANSDINKKALDYAQKGIEGTIKAIDMKNLDIIY
jgi:pilus assembly protein CpaC